MLLYGEGVASFGVPVEVLNYIVPPSQAVRLKSLICWGDTPGEYEIYIDSILRGGIRTSDQKRTDQVWWGSTFIANENEEVVIVATHHSTGMRALKCNLELDRLT